MLALLLFAASAQAVERPRLVVGVVVDQMRWDYLYRYEDRWGEGGFKRLLSEGRSMDETYINYVPTVTAAGHSTIFSGATPAVSGIAANNFCIGGREVYCTDDHSVRSVGSATAEGEMSPRNMMVLTIGDQLKLASDFRSRVVGVALKDRASILPAGHAADAAFWFDYEAKRFISSTYYMQSLPEWMRKYDDELSERLAGVAADSVKYSSLGITLTRETAERAVDGYALGQREAGITDMLCVSFSSTDYVGHQWGTRGAHTDDVYLTLDRELSHLLSFLDKRVGRGRYLLFLTADHGAAHSAQFMLEHGEPAGIWNPGPMKYVKSIIDYRVYVDSAAVAADGKSMEEAKRLVAGEILRDSAVVRVVDYAAARTATLPEDFRVRLENGWYPGRSGDLFVILRPGFYHRDHLDGTDHGTPYPYDTHIPLLFAGWHVSPGSVSEPCSIVDIAATVCAALHIQRPDGCFGRPLPLH